MKVGVSLMDAREAARTARKQRAHMEARAMDAGQRIIVARDARAGHRGNEESGRSSEKGCGAWREATGYCCWPKAGPRGQGRFSVFSRGGNT